MKDQELPPATRTRIVTSRRIIVAPAALRSPSSTPPSSRAATTAAVLVGRHRQLATALGHLWLVAQPFSKLPVRPSSVVSAASASQIQAGREEVRASEQ